MAKRQKRERETSEFADMMRRMVVAHGRRVADGDAYDLAELVELGKLLDEVTAQAVAGVRQRHGLSWAEIAGPLGITRQAAQMRWGKAAVKPDTRIFPEPVMSEAAAAHLVASVQRQRQAGA